MNRATRAMAVLAAGTIAVWAAPLLGVAAIGRPVVGFLDFPPRTTYVVHPPFSWPVFTIMMLPTLLALGLYIAALRCRTPSSATCRGRFPWWGWVGLWLAMAAWVLAWHGEVLPAEWRRHTFTPLWLGYILVVNGLVQRRRGTSPLSGHTRWYLLLFPVSAGYWWLYEHLNRFVANWHYSGIGTPTDWEYFLQATLPFSTVLPALAATTSWLATCPRLDRMRLPAPPAPRGSPVAAVLAGTLALAGIGVWPGALYPALWIGPLLVFLGLQQLLLGRNLLSPLRSGDWRPLLQPALAGLVCGFFWELWNYGAAARWHYSIPYVQRFHLFEMPLLGYAGYLPFGVLCAVIADLVRETAGRRDERPAE